MNTNSNNYALSISQEILVDLPNFEGPLDLLLFLINKNEINIYDISINLLTHEYLKILNSMKNLNIEISGEFFVMAGTLMYIKSRMLLPEKEQVGENIEEEDPRWELAKQLVEYKKYKEIAHAFEILYYKTEKGFARSFSETLLDNSKTPLKSIYSNQLFDAFSTILSRLKERVRISSYNATIVTIPDQIKFLNEKLENNLQINFYKLFSEGEHPFEVIIATFMAILELAKLNEINIQLLKEDIILSRRINGL